MIMSVLSWVCLTYNYLEPHKNNPLEKEYTWVLHNSAWRNYVLGEGLAKGDILQYLTLASTDSFGLCYYPEINLEKNMVVKKTEHKCLGNQDDSSSHANKVSLKFDPERDLHITQSALFGVCWVEKLIVVKSLQRIIRSTSSSQWNHEKKVKTCYVRRKNNM